jgi:short subunit fatty acids transporter
MLFVAKKIFRESFPSLYGRAFHVIILIMIIFVVVVVVCLVLTTFVCDDLFVKIWWAGGIWGLLKFSVDIINYY